MKILNHYKVILVLLVSTIIFVQCKSEKAEVLSSVQPEQEAPEKTEINALTQDTTAEAVVVTKQTVPKKAPTPPAPILPDPHPRDPRDPRIFPPEPPCPPPPIDEPIVEEVVTFADPMPEFPGGPKALMKFISENTKYPEVDRETGTQGTVYVWFIVEKDGAITNIEIARGISSSLDKEAKRVISIMPKWIPAKDNKGQAVRCRQALPIKFTLD